MPVTQRWVHSGLIFASMVFILSIALLAHGAARSTVSDHGIVGSRAPDFQLRDLAFRPVTASDYANKTLVMVFADRNTDCAWALKQVDHMMTVFAPNDNVRFLGVQFEYDASLLAKQDDRRGSMENSDRPLRVAIDPDGSVARDFRIVQSPYVIIVRDGIIRKRLALHTEADAAGCMKALREEVVATIAMASR